jgi:hypothetical protein
MQDVAMIAAARSAIVIVIAALLSGCLCSTETVAERTSPDGRHVAVVQRRGCGATTADVIRIVVRSRWRFAADPVVVMDEPSSIDVKWRSSTELVVTHSDVRVHKDEAQVDGVRITRIVKR